MEDITEFVKEKVFILLLTRAKQKKWALRKSMRQNKEAIVNIYELKEDWDGFKLLSFEEENEKWLEFVCACRKGENINSDYDIIIGNAAGDEDIGLVGGRESFGRYHFSRKFHL